MFPSLDSGTGQWHQKFPFSKKLTQSLSPALKNQHLDISSHSFYIYIQKHTHFIMLNIAVFSPTHLFDFDKINNIASLCMHVTSNMGKSESDKASFVFSAGVPHVVCSHSVWTGVCVAGPVTVHVLHVPVDYNWSGCFTQTTRDENTNVWGRSAGSDANTLICSYSPLLTPLH